MQKTDMLKALKALDNKLTQKGKMLLGGGGAMVLAYNFPLSTLDLDATFYKTPYQLTDIQQQVIAVANELNLPKDWLNPYFQTFLYSLPEDYESRLRTIYEGKHLTVNAIGPEDLLILKCFAGRDKDIPHARALLKTKLNLDLVEQHIYKLIDKKVPKSNEALDFLNDLLDELE